MTQYTVSVSPEAKNDLQEIKTYISKNLENPQAAKNVVSKITQQIKGLRQTPGMGHPLSPVVGFETPYRFLVCGNYLVFYRWVEKLVLVDRIIYGGRDYVQILFPESLFSSPPSP
jgi:addiction module RelE/StbE family toxin